MTLTVTASLVSLWVVIVYSIFQGHETWYQWNLNPQPLFLVSLKLYHLVNNLTSLGFRPDNFKQLKHVL